MMPGQAIENATTDSARSVPRLDERLVVTVGGGPLPTAGDSERGPGVSFPNIRTEAVLSVARRGPGSVVGVSLGPRVPGHVPGADVAAVGHIEGTGQGDEPQGTCLGEHRPV